MKEQKFIKKGRTGREGVALKTYGMVAAAIGLIWALLSLIIAEGYSAMIVPSCVLLVGGLLFWVGHGLARSASGVRA
jgi:hypothetical protein